MSRAARVLANPAVRIFVWSRLAIWLAALFALLEFDPNRSVYADRLDVPRLTHDLGFATDVWARWDSVPYLQIAAHGYGGVKGSPAFYPLYPWLVGGVGRILGGNYVLAGIVVSLAAAAGSFVLFERLARERLGADGSRRALLYLALFPMSLFLQAVYAESLLLLLVLGAFVAAERGAWPLAWTLTGLALLTRPTAVALVPSLLLLAWRSRARIRAFASIAIAPVLFLAFPVVLQVQTGRPTAFMHAESEWHRHLSVYGPFSGLWRALHAAWAGVLQLTVGSPSHWYWTPVNPARTAVLNLEYLAYLVVLLILTAVAWRRFGAVYGLYAAVSVLIPLTLPSDLYPLLSLPRLAVTIFPIFLALATVTHRERAHSAVVCVSAVLLGTSVAGWATWQWVS